MGKAHVIGALRTPIGSYLGKLSNYTAPELMAHLIGHWLQCNDSKLVDQISDIIVGQVIQAGVGQAPARQASILGGLKKSVHALTINKVCGSGLKAVVEAAKLIERGDAQVVIAGGMESMSRAPHYVSGLRSGVKFGNQELKDGMLHDGLWDPYNNFAMGNAAELCAKKYEFSREAQDKYARESFEFAQRAQKENVFHKEIVAFSDVKKGELAADEGPGKANFEKMTKLKPAFDPAGTITAANASTLADGAALIVLCSESVLKEFGVSSMGIVQSWNEHSHDPEWFTTAPTASIQKLLEKNKLRVSDVDVYEINEAFAVVSMHSMKELNIPREKLNPNGGAIALGHPIGSSGTRLLVTLAHHLQRHNLKKGVASLCIGGGEAISVLLERA